MTFPNEDGSVIDPNPGAKERLNADGLLGRMHALGARIEWVALIKSLV